MGPATKIWHLGFTADFFSLSFLGDKLGLEGYHPPNLNLVHWVLYIVFWLKARVLKLSCQSVRPHFVAMLQQSSTLLLRGSNG